MNTAGFQFAEVFESPLGVDFVRRLIDAAYLAPHRRPPAYADDAAHRPLLHATPAAQQVLVLVLQHCWPAGQATLPQQVAGPLEQNFTPELFVQQTDPDAHDVLPQHNPPETEQKVCPEVPVQQTSPAGQDELPQQSRPAAIQKLPGQHDWPAGHLGEQVWASARPAPRARRILPNNIDHTSRRASRRGIGVAKIRAISSIRWFMFDPLP